MKAKQRSSVIYLCVTGLLVISFFVSGCGPGQLLGPTLTPTPTNTSTPTNTPTPTTTPTTTPTITPAPTATNTPSPTPLPGLGVARADIEKAFTGFGYLAEDRPAVNGQPVRRVTSTNQRHYVEMVGDPNALSSASWFWMPNRNDQTDNIEALVTQVLFFNAVMPKFAEQGQAWASQAETDIINTGNKVQQTTIGNLQLVMMVQSGTIVIIVKKP